MEKARRLGGALAEVEGGAPLGGALAEVEDGAPLGWRAGGSGGWRAVGVARWRSWTAARRLGGARAEVDMLVRRGGDAATLARIRGQ